MKTCTGFSSLWSTGSHMRKDRELHTIDFRFLSKFELSSHVDFRLGTFLVMLMLTRIIYELSVLCTSKWTSTSNLEVRGREEFVEASLQHGKCGVELLILVTFCDYFKAFSVLRWDFCFVLFLQIKTLTDDVVRLFCSCCYGDTVFKWHRCFVITNAAYFGKQCCRAFCHSVFAYRMKLPLLNYCFIKNIVWEVFIPAV